MRSRHVMRMRTQWWVVTIVTSLLVAGLIFDRTLVRLDNIIYDQLLRLDHPPSSQQILLVEIDNESLQRIGRWPWSRETHAALINQIAKAKPKAIAYDVLFAEPGAEDEDRRLGEAIAAAHPVFLPLFSNTPGLSGAPVELIEPIMRSEEHTSELQSLMRSSYAVFFLQQNKKK